MRIFLLLFLFTLVFCNYNWDQTEKIIQQGIADGVFSGCVLGVASNNSTYLKKPYGTTIPRRGLFAPAMQANYKFDINRLSQVIGVNTVLMTLIDANTTTLAKRVASVLSDFNNNGKLLLTVQQMLLHNSGFPAQYNDAFPATPAQLLKKIEGLKLDYTIQTKFQYSQIGYTVLGHLVQKTTNQTLKDAMSTTLIISGLRDTGYLPTTPKDSIVPGGYNKGICHGVPYNKYAHFLNNMAGNAGLFSTIDNMITYMQIMLSKGKANNTRIFSEDVVNMFTSVTPQKKYNNTFAKGWQTVPTTNPPCGKKFSPNSFGLADPSGSYAWADKQKNVTIVLLANGNFPAPRKDIPAQFLGKLSDAIMTALGH